MNKPRDETIQWVDAEGAKQIPEGRTVISRRIANGETYYDVSHHHRPDWVEGDNSRPGEWSWAILDSEVKTDREERP